MTSGDDDRLPALERRSGDDDLSNGVSGDGERKIEKENGSSNRLDWALEEIDLSDLFDRENDMKLQGAIVSHTAIAIDK
uniref:Uncharacterized protein n=1 Tax=Cannabis sativa TaxID=3483 RepID=A0A803Q7Z8_CANSA